MKSVMSHNFATTPQINAPRSVFDRTFGHKTTFDAGWLIPVFWDSVLPGDTFNVSADMFARLATPLFPIMDNMTLDSQFFFVPNRLIWDNWRKFCGEQIDPGDSIDYSIPILSGTRDSLADGSFATDVGRTGLLLNYMGVPDGIDATDVNISALPFRAYALIYNEWYRDQNLIDSVDTNTGDSATADTLNSMRIQRRGKRHDYFTSCLPWPQKGDAVDLPLGTSAEIKYDTSITGTDYADKYVVASPSASGPEWAYGNTVDTNTGALDVSTRTNLLADLTTATAATINDLREAFQVQKLLERDARAGTRYSEVIKNHYGIDFYDISYRPEYLGGGSTPINISPIAATGGVETDRAVGDLGAVGTAFARGHGFTKTFVEHGIVMGIVSVRCDLTYQQGLNRHFSHSTRYDIYWPSLAHLGEQSVLNKEIYCDGSANDDLVFGYIPRYDEYRYKPFMITGFFQSAATGTLDAWHLSQEFSSLPTLGQTFIEETPPIDRVIQVPTEPHFIFDSVFKMKCARAMPTFGVPGLIDHF
jgi:hypothetical protein